MQAIARSPNPAYSSSYDLKYLLTSITAGGEGLIVDLQDELDAFRAVRAKRCMAGQNSMTPRSKNSAAGSDARSIESRRPSAGLHLAQWTRPACLVLREPPPRSRGGDFLPRRLVPLFQHPASCLSASPERDDGAWRQDPRHINAAARRVSLDGGDESAPLRCPQRRRQSCRAILRSCPRPGRRTAYRLAVEQQSVAEHQWR
jgi:hypothetical protein